MRKFIKIQTKINLILRLFWIIINKNTKKTILKLLFIINEQKPIHYLKIKIASYSYITNSALFLNFI